MHNLWILFLLLNWQQGVQTPSSGSVETDTLFHVCLVVFQSQFVFFRLANSGTYASCFLAEVGTAGNICSNPTLEIMAYIDSHTNSKAYALCVIAKMFLLLAIFFSLACGYSYRSDQQHAHLVHGQCCWKCRLCESCCIQFIFWSFKRWGSLLGCQHTHKSKFCKFSCEGWFSQKSFIR